MLCLWVPLFMSILHSRHWQDSGYWGETVNTLDKGSHYEHDATESEEEVGFLTMLGRVLLFDSMIYIVFFAVFIILLGL